MFEMDKIKEWLELAQQHDETDFWRTVLERGTPGVSGSSQEEAEENDKIAMFPAVDIFYEEYTNLVVMELPGAFKEDVQVTVSGNVLTVRGFIKHPTDSPQTAIKTERFYGPFERSIVLPQLGEPPRISARLDRGLLLIRYPRALYKEEWIDIG
ncbi:Hsp20/alpha crystallin family protein [Paenibacillus hamazuiensis]|uniref:Hsp20/alpha crystallin family protein n=1 Tax=Paenibacillus hamazuiensis TaxID=2936508 RepID=UPI00200D5F17|nr:Hsp20/alpha crystallin family protein [Paenibacillus hamazuiensis]